MKLFLASEAKHPQSLVKLKEFIGGFDNKKIGYVPTAANGECPFEDWKTNSETFSIVQNLGAKVTAIQLEDYKNNSVIPLFEDQDIFWFAGGQPGYLLYWMRRCGLDKVIRKLLESRIYVGSSAGSMVASKTIKVTEWFFGEGEWGASVIPGLGLIDFEIYPHFEESQMEYIQKHNNTEKLYLLKNGEAVLVEDEKISVFGEERVLVKHE